ncbi:MAG: lipoyl(octanoyl) transferase LipB [Cellvibrionaceae bacterium]|nr:lipoyl(octanoyl) transferase LipB [Cellvibrionaceae bacterium]
MTAPCQVLRVRQLGLQPYVPIWQAMSTFTDQRDAHTQDELWLLQHPPVFTQGRAGKSAHLLRPGAIPLVHSDRGGQISYHGPGQLIVYALIDLRRRQLGVRAMVSLLEQVVIDLLAQWGLVAYAKADAPGVYLAVDGPAAEGGGEAKIASLGLRVRKGCCFHGVSINVDMDLSPFACINPCGYAGLKMTSMAQQPLTAPLSCEAVARALTALIAGQLEATPQVSDAFSPPLHLFLHTKKTLL